MLQIMHSARNTKERAEIIKEQAKAKAKERMHKEKMRNKMISSVMEEAKTKDLPPYIPIQVESLTIIEIALVDSDASLNIVSSKLLWQVPQV